MMTTHNTKKTAAYLALAIVALTITAPVLAGTGGSELNAIYDWFAGLIQGTGGKLLAVIALIGAVAVTAVTMKVAGVGGLLFIVIVAAFGVAFINSMITGLV